MPAKPSIFVMVVIAVPGGKIPVVRDLSKPAPLYWKPPGGKSEPEEDALLEFLSPKEVWGMAGRREVRQETGIVIPDTHPFRVLKHELDPKGFMKVMLSFNLAQMPEHLVSEEEDMEVALMTPFEIVAAYNRGEFHPEHFKFGEEYFRNLIHLHI